MLTPEFWFSLCTASRHASMDFFLAEAGGKCGQEQEARALVGRSGRGGRSCGAATQPVQSAKRQVSVRTSAQNERERPGRVLLWTLATLLLLLFLLRDGTVSNTGDSPHLLLLLLLAKLSHTRAHSHARQRRPPPLTPAVPAPTVFPRPNRKWAGAGHRLLETRLFVRWRRGARWDGGEGSLIGMLQSEERW